VSKGIGAYAHKVFDDGAAVLYEYGSYNLNLSRIFAIKITEIMYNIDKTFQKNFTERKIIFSITFSTTKILKFSFHSPSSRRKNFY